MEFKIIAKTFQGLEEVLAQELDKLGASNVKAGNRMVSFTGDQEMLYRANFCLRTAVKVLKPIKEFRATDADEVYEVAKQVPWDEYMDVKQTILVDSVVFSENFRHSKFVAYRVKDAIADYFRDKTGERPNVSISNPDIRVNVHISESLVTLSLDSSGESLHKRGYRKASGAAPLNEVLAAGMIQLAGWHGQCDLIDPFCGSGTILVEAALIAQNIYPGVFREEFGFERWKDFDEELLERIYNDDSQEREFDHKIYGFDINRQAVGFAIGNARAAGVGKVVDVQQQDFYEFEWTPKPAVADDDVDAEAIPPRPALIITNPPYGERVTTDDILDLYKTIGERLKHSFAGNDAWILSSHEECFDQIGFRPSTKIALYNGALPCEFRRYQVFAGKLRDLRMEGVDIKSAEERSRNAKYKPYRRKDEDGEFDGHGWRGTGSRDDEHYFRSRPDAKKFEPRKRKPLSDGDAAVGRHNFKWGDRPAGYRRDDGADRWRDDSSSRRERPFRGDREPNPYGRDRRPFDRRDDRRDDRPFRKPWDGDRRPRPRFGDEERPSRRRDD